MSKTAALCWLLPEWAHVILWAVTGYVPAAVSFCGYHLGYRWQYFEHIHADA